MLHIDDYLRIAQEMNASDLHLKADAPPLLRIDGLLQRTDLPPLDSAEIAMMFQESLPSRHWDRFCSEWELDAAYATSTSHSPLEEDERGTPDAASESSRYRLNLFKQRGTVEAVFRIIPTHLMTMEEIGLPKLARSFASRVRGLLLVTGPVGSGKTTTQAAMIDSINERLPCHIITIEDPIEYIHENRAALVSQRELGHDTETFAGALRSALREDPDVILVGEMRDLETIRMAITAAETGHLVLSTLHTLDAAETINRIIDIFPTHQQDQVRMQLAVNLIGVVGQTLVRRASGEGRVAAFEVMANLPAVATAIRENKIYQINSALQSGQKTGMVSLDRSLADLVKSGEVEYEEGLWRAKNPDDYTQFALGRGASQKAS